MEQLVGKNKDILLNGTNMDIIDFIGAIEKMLLKYEWPHIEQISAEFDSRLRCVNAFWNTLNY